MPDSPGVYFFTKGKEILYIGKATSLKNRTKTYFGKDLIETRGPLLVDMVFKADKVDFEVTDSVLEAIILEANLIKRHQPKYNTKEKSDKSFNYVCITKADMRHGVNELPRVVIVRGKQLQSQKYKKVFGPYPNNTQLREALKIVRRIFPFLDDKSKNYLEFYKQINLIPDLEDTKLYLQNIRNIILFFSGKKHKIYINLSKQMREYAKAEQFEKAGEIKRQYFAVEHINDVALLKADSDRFLQNRVRIEAYDIAHMGGKNMVGVMTVIKNGQPDKNEYRKFKIRTQDNSNDTGALIEVLHRRLDHIEWTYPNLIVVDGGVAQINAAEKVLKKLNIHIPVVSVLKDERHKPKAIKGNGQLALDHKAAILLGNSEAHRFAITYHKKIRARNFLP